MQEKLKITNCGVKTTDSVMWMYYVGPTWLSILSIFIFIALSCAASNVISTAAAVSQFLLIF